MTMCPKCNQATLFEVRDINPKLLEYVCPVCAYYESNSEAYRSSKGQMFDNLGRTILKRLENELGALGLTVEQTRAWAQNEPTFTKRNFTALDPKRQLYRTCVYNIVYTRFFWLAMNSACSVWHRV
jgi:hypothetical protein